MIAAMKFGRTIVGNVTNSFGQGIQSFVKERFQVAMTTIASIGHIKLRYHNDEQIKKLAVDVRAGLIFGTWMMREGDMESLVSMVFMPLVFMEQKDKEKMKEDGVLHLFAFYTESAPRSINGYPIFFSMGMLTGEDSEALRELIGRLEEAEKTVLEKI